MCGEVEDEEHFLNAYRSIYRIFFIKLANVNYQCLNLTIILDNHNYYVLKNAKFIENCFKQRETGIS